MKKLIPVILSAITLVSCSGSEVSAPAPQPPEEYSRFIIDEHFSLPEDEEVYEYTLAPFTAGENSLSALSAVFFTPDEKLSAIQNGDTLTTEDKQKTLTLLPDGRFEYSAPALDPDEKWTAPVDTVFQNAFEDTTLRLETGSITLEELSLKAQSYLTDCMRALSLDIVPTPLYADIFTCQCDGAENDYAKIYFALPVGECSVIKPLPARETLPVLDNAADSYSLLCICLADDAMPFAASSQSALLVPDKKGQQHTHIPCDDVIVNAGSKYLSAAKHMTLMYAELEYITKDGFTALPYWALYFSLPDGRKQIYYENALTGEGFTSFDPFALALR